MCFSGNWLQGQGEVALRTDYRRIDIQSLKTFLVYASKKTIIFLEMI